MPTATADRELFFQDVSLLLQALLGLAVGEEQVRPFLVMRVWNAPCTGVLHP